MSEQAVADFVGRVGFDTPDEEVGEPVDARFVMSRRRLVVAASDERVTIPLSSVVDVVVGNVPPRFRDVFDDVVTIAHRPEDGGISTMLVEGDNETISRFVTVLFKCLLSGTEVMVKHPASVGGRITDEPARLATLSTRSDEVEFVTADDTFTIDIGAVVDFDRTNRGPDGEDRTTLAVAHAGGEGVVTTLVAPPSSRKVNLLGRFLRIEYSNVRQEVAEISLNDSEKRVLVAVYATGGDIDFSSVLDGDAARTTNVINALREKGLVDETESGLSMTAQGRVVVAERIEDVNE